MAGNEYIHKDFKCRPVYGVPVQVYFQVQEFSLETYLSALYYWWTDFENQLSVECLPL